MEENKKERERKKADWNIRPYLAIGLTAFIVILISMAAFFLIYRYEGVARLWERLMIILQPIIIGLVIAYLVTPIVNFEERHLLPLAEKKMKNPKKAARMVRGVSVAGALLFVLLIIGILLQMVLPELYNSIMGMIETLPLQMNSFIKLLNEYIDSESKIAVYVEELLSGGIQFFQNWVQSDFLPQTKNILTMLTSGVISVVKVVFNIVIGMIISVYVLMSKETFVGQTKKLVYAIFPAKQANVIIETVHKSNEIFGGFISGKILDSLIIGILCFVVLYLLKMPYTVLVSVIVGVTNIIPFFGPYLGAVPSAILITLANPIQGVYFVIFILVLQQVDGNIIGPKILGNSTGLSSFWVVFAILVFGGLFGIVGMIMGVPVFAVIYYIAKKMFYYILDKKHLPRETEEYILVKRYNIQEERFECFSEEKKLPKEIKKKTKKEKED